MVDNFIRAINRFWDNVGSVMRNHNQNEMIFFSTIHFIRKSIEAQETNWRFTASAISTIRGLDKWGFQSYLFKNNKHPSIRIYVEYLMSNTSHFSGVDNGTSDDPVNYDCFKVKKLIRLMDNLIDETPGAIKENVLYVIYPRT